MQKKNYNNNGSYLFKVYLVYNMHACIYVEFLNKF